MSGPDPSEKEGNQPQWKDRNRDLRLRWIDLNAQIVAAREAGNNDIVEQLTAELGEIGNDFYHENRGLAAVVARSFLNSKGDAYVDDYLNAAALGLWEAFLAWDPTRGATFGTFSRNFIKGRVSRTVRRYEYQHMGQEDFNRRKDIRSMAVQLNEELGRTPTHDEIATALGIRVAVVARALAPQAVSLDKPVGDGDDRLGDIIEIVDIDADEIDTAPTEEVLEELSDLELWLTLVRNNLLGSEVDVSLMEISDTIGVGREITRRANKRAQIRIAATRFTQDHGRNPTWDELAELGGYDVNNDEDMKTLRVVYTPSVDDLQGRWWRARKALITARRSNDREAWQRARRRLDRIGEEVLATYATSIAQMAVGHRLSRQHTEGIGVTEAARDLWYSFCIWEPDHGTFTTFARAQMASRHPRTKAEGRADVPSDAELRTAWASIRRDGLDLRGPADDNPLSEAGKAAAGFLPIGS